MAESRKLSLQDAMTMAIQLHKNGLLEEARSIYGDVLRISPDNPDATHYMGVVVHQMGDSDSGLEYVQRSLELAGENAAVLNNLGNIYQELGRLEQAQAAYSRVLELAPDHADTWVNLGVILRDLKQPEAALQKLMRALEISPEHVDAYHNLGNIYRDLGRNNDALEAYLKSAKLTPEHERTPKAIAKLQYDLGRREEAIWTLNQWIQKRPEDAMARHLLAAYSGKNIPARASDGFIRQCFDSFSNSFDEVLSRLDYKAPALVADCANRLLSSDGRSHRVLDIGCGTGLCGPLLKPIASALTGVDLSKGMLAKAEKRGVYDELIESELTEFMCTAPGQFDLVTCVDTFVYFGDLRDALLACSNTLVMGGHLIFTVEQHTHEEHAEGFWLRPHGRYSHSRENVIGLLTEAGIMVLDVEDVILRNEGGERVRGMLVSARKE